MIDPNLPPTDRELAAAPERLRPGDGERRVTMRHIAEAIGVTPATVSMALANHARISLSTRRRVQRAAHDLGYVANPFVSALMRTRRLGRDENTRPVIALINVHRQREGWSRHPASTVRQMWQGVNEQARRRGYRTEDFWLHEPAMTPGRLSEILRARGIRGVLLSPFADDGGVPALRWDYFGAAAIAVPQPDVPIPTVCNDHYFSMVRILEECRRRGYRRPGLVVRHQVLARLQGRWEAGFLMSGELFPELRPVPMFRPSSIEADMAGLDAWLGTHQPDVIVTSTADTVEVALRRLGLTCPDDIGLAWTGCPEMGHAISGIYQNGFMIGAAALDTVVAMVERNESGLSEHARSLMIQGEWNAGTTLRSLPREQPPGHQRGRSPVASPRVAQAVG